MSKKYIGNITSKSRVSDVVLPVFFGQIDAGVVTRNGFNTMVELNPQLKQHLEIIAVSKPLIPGVFCFTSNIDESTYKKISEGITKWHTTPSGRQCLTIFRTDKLDIYPVSVLNPSLDLIAEYEQLLTDNTNPEIETTTAKDR